MTEPLLTAWLLTYAVHAALFAALAAVAERTRWGAAPSRRDAFWKLALVGGIVTSAVFATVGSTPAGAEIQLPSQTAMTPALTNGNGTFWIVTAWTAITALFGWRAARAWHLGVRHAGRRRVIRRGRAILFLREILGPAADRVALSCSRTLRVPVAFAREICVPLRALRELPDDELRALLAHEAAHVVRRDAAWLMIAAAVRALGWWQPLNLLAAARLRLAMELSCDERAASNSRERAALARCLVKVAGWNVCPLRGDNRMLATMAGRGSALRQRVETLLDDAPRRRRMQPAGAWLGVGTVAVPVVCLAPLVTIARLAAMPEAAAALVRQTSASETPAARVIPVRARANPHAASRSPKAAVAEAQSPVASARAAAADASRDQRSAPTLQSTPGAEPLFVPSTPSSTPLRDAIAAARTPPAPASLRTSLDIPDAEPRGLRRIAKYVGFDTKRPKVDVPTPEQRGVNWIAQHAQRIPNP